MTDNTNSHCRTCPHAQLRIRGLWCLPLDQLVEYATEPPCTTTAPPSPKDT